MFYSPLISQFGSWSFDENENFCGFHYCFFSLKLLCILGLTFISINSFFQEFLCKEFSEENLLFWLECEKLRTTPPSESSSLQKQIDEIYNKYISTSAQMPVNIDSNGAHLAHEAVKGTPTPDAFNNQQQQIFKLMKLDSYPRFLTSSMFQVCY